MAEHENILSPEEIARLTRFKESGKTKQKAFHNQVETLVQEGHCVPSAIGHLAPLVSAPPLPERHSLRQRIINKVRHKPRP